MNLLIYIISAVLLAVLIVWTWNNSKDFDSNSQRAIFIIIGIVAMILITFILYLFSRNGIEYPNSDISRQVRKVIMLIFMPVNGFISLPHIASIKGEILSGMNDEDKTKKKIIILAILIIIAIIFEINYLHNFQNGILIK